MSQTRHKKKHRGDPYNRLAPFGDYTKASNRSIVILDRLLLFYAADAVIRIGGIYNLDRLPSWWDLYDQAVMIVEHLFRVAEKDKSRHFVWPAGFMYSEEHVEALKGFCFDRDKTKQEIRRRLASVKFGEKWLRGGLDTGTAKGVEDLLWYMYNGGISSARRLGAGKYAEFLLKDVKPPLRPDFQDPLGRQQEALLLFYERIAELETGEDPDVKGFPMSTLARQIPLEPWDRVAPELMQEELKLYARILGSILDGRLDRLPSDLFNRIKAVVEAGVIKVEKYPRADGRMKYVNQPRFVQFREAVPTDDEDREMSGAAWRLLKRADEAREAINEIAEKSRKPDAIHRAINALQDGMGFTEAAEKGPISRDTLYEVLKKLKEKIK